MLLFKAQFISCAICCVRNNETKKQNTADDFQLATVFKNELWDLPMSALFLVGCIKRILVVIVTLNHHCCLCFIAGSLDILPSTKAYLKICTKKISLPNYYAKLALVFSIIMVIKRDRIAKWKLFRSLLELQIPPVEVKSN